ncbi:MAG: division/cell wall cluster transcriptional repressor MraZ [Actinobacteria bacterium]|nr:division/cell wall cluster transcriptional repressor MraZ [Actinomycetota bacterium]
MFLGTHENIIDEKGRVIMPSRFRPELEEGAVMVYWFEECVAVFTLREFKKMAKKVASLPHGQRDRRSLERVVFSNAYEATPDRQGRLTIPPRLRQLAGLNREVVTVGLMNRVEIWDRERWETSMQGGIKSLEETAEKLAWSGF